MNGASFVLEAPAKLTLSLRVTGLRPDGCHLIDAEMVTLELADSLTVDTSRTGIEIVGAFAGDLAAELADDLAGDLAGDSKLAENNLVDRALKLVNRTAHVVITKNIPSGGGLGGGSADAAAILRWAGFKDLTVAAKLGADVAFCMVGGRARVTGIGEIVNPMKKVARKVTLVVPPFRVSTPAVYRAYDELTDRCRNPLRFSGVNDLEPAAIKVEPRLAEWKKRISQHAGAEPTLAGSGSTWWLDGEFADLAAQL
ncbi:MAG: 4-(cytidine 5'-diphospho)-2-C-methyl-D-erythritol kinase, partial [Actinomycetota bacterium]